MNVAVVNGGTRGIGKGIADALESEGWKVYATGRKTCDATDYFKVLDFFRKIETIDLLVNCAGVYAEIPLDKQTSFDFEIIFKTNFKGYLNWIQAVLPSMRHAGKGYIINISSMAAKRVRPGCGAYAVSKTAVNTLTQTVLCENLAHGVRATAICPGDTDTDIGRSIAPVEELLPVSDVVNTVLWLLSLSDKAVVPEVCIERRGRY